MALDLQKTSTYRLTQAGVILGIFVVAVFGGGLIALRHELSGAIFIVLCVTAGFSLFARVRSVHRKQRDTIFGDLKEAWHHDRDAGIERPTWRRKKQATTPESAAPQLETPSRTLSKKEALRRAQIEAKRAKHDD